MTRCPWPCPVDSVVIRAVTYEDLDPGGVAREFADSRGMSDAGAPDYGTRRWAEWTLGRAAVRDAAETVGLTDVVIEASSKGAPIIAGSSWGVSIAHTRGVVMGAVGPGRVGVDVEREDRDVSRLLRALLPGEQELTVSLGSVSVFVAKEAAAKATGLGLGGSLARWPIIDVELSGPSPRASVASPVGGVIEVRLWQHAGYVTGLAVVQAIG